MKKVSALCLAPILLCALNGNAAEQVDGERAFITLGTMGGPIASPVRSQPANLILLGRDAYLVDVGDGTAEQLAKAKVSLTQVRGLFISHLHFDHTGGLGAVLGLRYQTNVPFKLKIFGPPGTRALVDGIIASMEPAAQAGYGLEGQKPVAPADTVEVTEIEGGANFGVGGFTVRTAQNTHYSFPVDSDADRRFKSLSYRFDLPGKSITYTGDTGPSPAVEALAKGSDILVSEMIDLDATVANVRRNNPAVQGPALDGVVQHLSKHHLSPVQVGEMAKRAQVGRVIVTHVVPGSIDPALVAEFKAEIARNFKGSAVIANDLDRFW